MVPVIAVEPAEIDIFPPRYQSLRQVQGLLKGVMPALAALADIGAAVAGDGHVQDDQFADGFGVRGGDGIGGGTAPVMPDQMKRVDAEMLVYQPPDVVADGLLVVAVGGAGAVAEAAQIRRDHVVVLGQLRDDMAPFVPGLRPAMQQHDRKALAGGDVVQSHVAEIGVVVTDHLAGSGRG